MIGQLERIYAQHRQGMFTLALSITRHADGAEDAVQDAFARLCRGGRAAPSGDLVAYVFAAVRNAALDQCRRSGREGQRTTTMFGPIPAGTDHGSIPEALMDGERDRLIQQALDTLPDAQREVIVMKLYGDLTFEQIAEASGEPLSTVASRYRRGLERLRETVETLV